MTKKDLINRARTKLLAKPGAQKGFVKQFISEVELHRRLLEKIPHRVLCVAVRRVCRDLDRSSCVDWFGTIGE
jgi:hypothetical protein